MKRVPTCVGLALLVFLNTSLFNAKPIAQSKPTSTGRLSGLIVDPGAARVTGAKIIIANKAFKQEVRSANDGSYEIILPNGKYTIRVQCDGFYPSRKSARIAANATTKLDIVIRGIRNDALHPWR